MIVADSTLLLHLALQASDPGDSRAARAAYDRGSEWTVPPLWASEVRHVVLKYVRGGQISFDDARATVHRLSLLVSVSPVDHDEVLRAAHALGLSGYDAEYAALADRLGVPLVTSDRHLLQSVPRAVAADVFAQG